MEGETVEIGRRERGRRMERKKAKKDNVGLVVIAIGLRNSPISQRSR